MENSISTRLSQKVRYILMEKCVPLYQKRRKNRAGQQITYEEIIMEIAVSYCDTIFEDRYSKSVLDELEEKKDG